MKMIESKWEGFKKACISEEASEVQVREMKMAFYAGATGLLSAQSSFVSDDDAMLKMESISDELKDFPKERLEDALVKGLH